MLLWVDPNSIQFMNDHPEVLVFRITCHFPEDPVPEADYPGLRFMQDGEEVRMDPIRVERAFDGVYYLDFLVHLYTASSSGTDLGPWDYLAYTSDEDEPLRVHRFRIADDDETGGAALIWGSNPRQVLSLDLDFEAAENFTTDGSMDTLPVPRERQPEVQGGTSRYDVLAADED